MLRSELPGSSALPPPNTFKNKLFCLQEALFKSLKYPQPQKIYVIGSRKAHFVWILPSSAMAREPHKSEVFWNLHWRFSRKFLMMTKCKALPTHEDKKASQFS